MVPTARPHREILRADLAPIVAAIEAAEATLGVEEVEGAPRPRVYQARNLLLGALARLDELVADAG